MSKIRINDLARELEVKSKAILDVLLEVGVTEKKTHSSSVEEHEAEKVRAHFRAAEAQAAPSRSARSGRDADEIKTKIDLSHISKPGDVLKQIARQQQTAAAPAPPPARPAPPVETKPAAAAATPTAAPAAPPAPKPAAPPSPPAPAPRFITPQSVARPAVVRPPAPPVTPPAPAAVKPSAPTAAPVAPSAAVPPRPVAPQLRRAIRASSFCAN